MSRTRRALVALLAAAALAASGAIVSGGSTGAISAGDIACCR